MNKKYKYLIALFLIVASFIAFGRILDNDFINYDDYQYITENSHIKSGINISTIKWAFTSTYFSYWHPLTWLSYMLEWNLFGANASGYHFISLLLHIGAVLFLFLFLNKTTKRLWPAAFVAALFALHPLRVESVAWAAERKDVLSMFFGMAALYAYAFYVEDKKISKYFICLLLFALSLMSKPMLVTLPFVMLLLDYWPLGRWQINPPQNDKTQIVIPQSQKKKNKKNKAGVIEEKKISAPVKSMHQTVKSLLWEKAPFVLLSMILSISLIWQQKAVGGMSSLESVTMPVRITNALVSYAAYLGKIFWPVNLAVFYPYQHSFPSWQVFTSVVILLLITFAVFYLVKKVPFLLAGWLWYLGTLFPVIGLLQAGAQAMADRYTYLPSIGIFIMLVWGLLYLIPKEKVRKAVLFPSAVFILAILTFLTWQMCGYWKNSVSVFNHALQITKNNDVAHANLGAALEALGKNQESLYHYQAALKINPKNSLSHYNLANRLRENGDIEEALNHYLQAAQDNQNVVDVHNNIGIIFEMYFNKYDDAIHHYYKALMVDDNNYGVHYNAGIALAKKGLQKEAAKHFRRAIELKPDFTAAHQALELVLSIKQEK